MGRLGAPGYVVGIAGHLLCLIQFSEQRARALVSPGTEEFGEIQWLVQRHQLGSGEVRIHTF